MSHYPLEELVARWQREELTAEQMVGQMLQVLLDHDRRLRELQRTRAAVPPEPPAPPPRRRRKT